MHGRVGTGSRTMADLVALAMARHGGKPALMHKVGGEWVEVSYEQLDGMVRELALGLVDLRIEPEDGFRSCRTRGRSGPTRVCDVCRWRDCRVGLPDELASGVPLRAALLRGASDVLRGRRAAGEGPRRRCLAG